MAKKRKPRMTKMNIKELADFVHGKSKTTVRVVKVIPPKINWRKVWEDVAWFRNGYGFDPSAWGKRQIRRAVESQLNGKGKKK